LHLSISRLFNPKVKRISKDMKASLQKENLGDWFLKKDYSMIRVYGFSAILFHLPIFLTPIMFALEFIRQRIAADIEHFTAHTKDSSIKYPMNVGSFIIKKQTTLLVVECVLKGMRFSEAYVMNYDPKGLISQRIIHVSRSPFVHWTIPDFYKEVNSIVYEFNWDSEDKAQASQGKKSEVPFSPLPSRTEAGSKRSMSEVTDMECDLKPPSKRPKVDTMKDVIDLEQEVILEFPKEIIEEEPAREEPAKQMVVAQPLVVTPEDTQSVGATSVAAQSKKNKIEEPTLRYQKYSYAAAHEGKFKTKTQLISSYMELKK